MDLKIWLLKYYFHKLINDFSFWFFNIRIDSDIFLKLYSSFILFIGAASILLIPSDFMEVYPVLVISLIFVGFLNKNYSVDILNLIFHYLLTMVLYACNILKYSIVFESNQIELIFVLNFSTLALFYVMNFGSLIKKRC